MVMHLAGTDAGSIPNCGITGWSPHTLNVHTWARCPAEAELLMSLFSSLGESLVPCPPVL